MRDFWVIWFYMANYGGPICVSANFAEDAADRATHGFSNDFKDKARVVVFDKAPAFDTKKALTVADRVLMRRLKEKYGRPWKSHLLKAWENDRASILLGEEHAAQFQSIRNKIGPSGLAKVMV